MPPKIIGRIKPLSDHGQYHVTLGSLVLATGVSLSTASNTLAQAYRDGVERTFNPQLNQQNNHEEQR